MAALRKVARVTIAEPVSGKQRRRTSGQQQPRPLPVETTIVDPAVMERARELCGTGQRIRVVSATEVMIVNDDR